MRCDLEGVHSEPAKPNSIIHPPGNRDTPFLSRQFKNRFKTEAVLNARGPRSLGTLYLNSDEPTGCNVPQWLAVKRQTGLMTEKKYIADKTKAAERTMLYHLKMF